MTTKFNKENGTYEIVGITGEELAVLSAMVFDMKCEAETLEMKDQIFEENQIGMILSDDEVKILSHMEPIEFPEN